MYGKSSPERARAGTVQGTSDHRPGQPGLPGSDALLALAISNMHRTFGNQATMRMLRQTQARSPTTTPAVQVQRVFKYGFTELRNGNQILQYLIQAYPRIMTKARIKDFTDIVRTRKPVQLRVWLKNNGIKESVESVLDAAAEALLEPMLGESTTMESSESSTTVASESTTETTDISMPEDQPATVESKDISMPDDQSDESDADWEPTGDEPETVEELSMAVETSAPTKTPAKKGKRTTKREPAQKRKRETTNTPSKKAKKVDEDAEAEALARRLERFKPPGGVPLVLITWNIQKYSRSTDWDVADQKRRAIASVMNVFHPSAMILQEVTSAELLLQGAKQATIGLLRTNLFAFESPVQSALEQGKPLESSSPFNLNRSGQPKHYPFANEYSALNGPLFHSYSGHYQESYPLLYDPTQVVGPPVPYIVEGSKGRYKLVPVQPDQRIDFSSSDVGKFKARPRPLLVWEMEIQTQGYLLRPDPPTKTGNGPVEAEWTRVKQARSTAISSGELRETKPLYLGVVHTSPSNEVGIEYETQELMQQAAWLKKQYGAHVILGGDWYMERESPAEFDRIARGKDWQMGAAPQRTGKKTPKDMRDTPHEVTETARAEDAKRSGSEEAHRFLPTSLPKKEEHRSQTADFFVLDKNFNVQFTSAISLAPSKQEAWTDTGDYRHQPVHVEKDLFVPTESAGIDHLAIITVVYA